jgi:hypothetical protein
MTTPSASTTTEFYDAKAGRIAIFNGGNYADFERTCEAALIVAGAWNFVTGREVAAEARSADAIKRRGCKGGGLYPGVTYRSWVKRVLWWCR